MKKFYETTRGARPVQVLGKAVRFNPYDMAAGNVMAVYATEDAKETDALDAMVAGQKHDVYSITEKQYDICLKKKSAASNPLGSTLFDEQTRRDAPAVVVNTEPRPAAPVGVPLNGVGDAVTVGKTE